MHTPHRAIPVVDEEGKRRVQEKAVITAPTEDLVLRYSHNIVEHLGLKLYQNKPTNVIAEIISNSWDADAARVAWHTPGGKAWETAPVMEFRRAEAIEFWAGRRLPSRHNMSAPDMIFGGFRGDGP